MPTGYEIEDKKVKYILLMEKLGSGRIRYTGWIREVDANGDSSMRMTTTIDNATEFDSMEFVDAGVGDADDSEYALINSVDYRVRD